MSTAQRAVTVIGALVVTLTLFCARAAAEATATACATTLMAPCQTDHDPYDASAIAPDLEDGYGHLVPTFDEAQAFVYTKQIAVDAYASLSAYPTGACCGGTSDAVASGVWVLKSQGQNSQPVPVSVFFKGDADSSSDTTGQISDFSSASWNFSVSVTGHTPYSYTATGTSYGDPNLDGAVVQQSYAYDSNGHSYSGNTAFLGFSLLFDAYPGDQIQLGAGAGATFDAWAVVDPVITVDTPGYYLESPSPISKPVDVAPSQQTFDEMASSGVDVARLASDGFLGSPTPEPGTLATLGTGILVAAGALRRNQGCRRRQMADPTSLGHESGRATPRL